MTLFQQSLLSSVAIGAVLEWYGRHRDWPFATRVSINFMVGYAFGFAVRWVLNH